MILRLFAAAIVASQVVPGDATAVVARVTSHPAFAQAMAAIDRDHDRLIAETIQLTEIPAPPFKEEARGLAMLTRFRALGLADVERDPEGNVVGLRKGTGGGPLVAIAAHLDTVFPEGTPIKVVRDGTKLRAPGVGDNSRSLAVVLAMIRAMNEAKVETSSDILFVADVGEEGLGDLRGVKYLFNKSKYKDAIKTFIALDDAGSGAQITSRAVGSKRYRATFTGPGGHSYTAFGIVSPSLAMGQAIAAIGTIAVPAAPKTTFNVGVVSGGTSVNSIPAEASMEIDMRSESKAELQKIDRAIVAALRQAVADENRARSTAQGAIALDLKLLGDRPTGATPDDAMLVQIALSAARSAGLDPALGATSTDANVPISLGIPAIRLNSGGYEERQHSPDEWIDVEKTISLRGIRSALTTLLAVAGMR